VDKIRKFDLKNDKNYIEFATLTKLFFSGWQRGFLLIERFY